MHIYSPYDTKFFQREEEQRLKRQIKQVSTVT